MEWFRWYHGAISDPKWPLIAKRSGHSIGVVVSIWAAILEHASQAEVRGSIADFDPEAIDALYGYEEGTTVTVCNAMKRQGVVTDNLMLSSWEKRQPKRERNDDSAERVRRHREKQKVNNFNSTGDCNADVTPSNDMQRQETPRTEQNRYKKEDMSEKPKSVSHDSISLPCEDGSEFVYEQKFLDAAKTAYPLIEISSQAAKARAWLEANPSRLKTRRGMTKFFNGWLSRAQGDAEKRRPVDAAVVTTGRDINENDYRPAKWALGATCTN